MVKFKLLDKIFWQMIIRLSPTAKNMEMCFSLLMFFEANKGNNGTRYFISTKLKQPATPLLRELW
jgi:hypothetical protein